MAKEFKATVRKLLERTISEMISNEDRLNYYKWIERTNKDKTLPIHWLSMPIDYLIEIPDEVPEQFRDYILNARRLKTLAFPNWEDVEEIDE